MAGKYSLTFDGATTLTNDIRTAITNGTIGNAGSVIQAYEVWIAGESSSSTPIRLNLGRASNGTTPGGTTTINKLSPSAPAASFTAASTWAVQPGSFVSIVNPAFNAFGNIARWTAPPGSAVVQMTITAATPVTISLRSSNGTATANGHILIEEL